MKVSDELLSSIKINEGFKPKPYKDHLGFLTIGYGTLIENGISKEEASMLLTMRLKNYIKELSLHKPKIAELSQVRQDVLFEMSYQLGSSGILKFKKMWQAIEDANFIEAGVQMLDSKWHAQTPLRARKLAQKMAEDK